MKAALTRPGPGLGLALGLALTTTVAGCASSGAAAKRSSLQISLADVSGAPTHLEAKDEQEVFVLAFWATWCQPCQSELAKMNGLHDELAPRGLRLYAVAIDGPDTVAQVRPWVEREGYRFGVLLDSETRVLGRFNVRGDIPYYVVLDAQGRVIHEHQGYVEGDVAALRTFLDGVLPAA